MLHKPSKFPFCTSNDNRGVWLLICMLLAQQQTQQHLQNQQQLVQQAAAQYGTNPQAHLVQQAIVQQSINSAPWQQAQQQAQQQVKKGKQNIVTVITFSHPSMSQMKIKGCRRLKN